MKTVDKYIARNFLHALAMCTLVMLAMRVLADLFVNMDEFAEVGEKLNYGWVSLAGYIASYYLHQCLIYFQEMGGVVLVAAAMFSLVRMNHTNELIAVMAGGMSLYRVMAPIIIGGMIFSGIGAFNQEVLIPAFKDKLTLDRDDAPGTKVIRVELIPDDKHNIWQSNRYVQESGQMLNPLIITRDTNGRQQAKISAARAIESPDKGGWMLKDASMVVLSSSRIRGGVDSRLVRTYRWPEKLSSNSDNIDLEDGLGISFESAYGGKLLVGAVFDIYAPASVTLKPRLMATIEVPFAMYKSSDSDSGYLLVDDFSVDIADIRNFPGLCAKLLSGERLSSDNVFGRLWATLDADTRELIRRCVENNADPNMADGVKIASSLNAAVKKSVFAAVPDANTHIDRDIAWLSREMYSAIVSSGADIQQVSGLLNRAILDEQLAPEIIGCGGEMLLYSSLVGEEIVLRESGKWLDLMSARELSAHVRRGSAPNPMAVSLAMHLRFTTPVSWVLMLMLGLPFVVSRDRKLKSSAMMCLLLVGGFYAFIFISRYLGKDVYVFIDTGLQHYGLTGLSRAWQPIFGAWIPIVVFVPVAVLMMDSIHSMHAYDLNDTYGELIFSPGGRIRRRVFWRLFPPVLGIIALGALIDLLWVRRLSLVFTVCFLVGLWPVLALHFKRCHDRNRSGMFALTPLVPLLFSYFVLATVNSVFELKLVGWMALSLFGSVAVLLTGWVIAETWLLAGDSGVNAYGDDPKGPAAA